MATIEIEIPDAHVPNVLEALAILTGWVSETESGVTKAENARRYMRSHLRRKVMQYRMNQEFDDGTATIQAELADWI
jgi:hypothetical protein